MLAKLSDCRQAYGGADAVAALAGLIPVTEEFGKRRAVNLPWAYKTHRRVAMTTFLHNSRHTNPWADDFCQRARADGKHRPPGIRILARVGTSAIYRRRQDRKPYNVAQGLTQPPQAA